MYPERKEIWTRNSVSWYPAPSISCYMKWAVSDNYFNKSRTDTPSWQQSLSIAIRKTAEYIKKHSTDKEKLTTTIGYKNFSAHKSRHQKFIIKVSDLLVMFDYLAYQDVMDFMKFLYTWTLEHIAVEDKPFVPAVFKYLQKQQAKLTTVMFSAVYQNKDFSAI